MRKKSKSKIYALSLVVSMIIGNLSGVSASASAYQTLDEAAGYTYYPTSEQVAVYDFGKEVTENTLYSGGNGHGFGDVNYPNPAAGWVGGIYQPRVSVESEGASYVKKVTNPATGKEVLEIGSKVWTETESTGYGVYTYENTSAFHVDLPNADYNVEITLVNPTDKAYTAYLEGENITKENNITVEPNESVTKTIAVILVDGRMDLKFLAESTATEEKSASVDKVYVSSVSIVRQATNAVTEKPTIFLASDSTVQTYDSYYYPQAGWGETLYQFFGEFVEERECENCSYSQSQTYETTKVVIENRAIGGRSSKSFIEEGKLDDLLEDVKPGDYVLVQWGHNDATTSRPNRYASIEEFNVALKYYIEGTRQRGGIPVLVTPVARYSPNANGTFASNFEGYRQAALQLGEVMSVPVLDLTKASIELCEAFGVEGAKALFLHLAAGEYPGAYAGGVADSTHLQRYGAYKFAQCVAKLIEDYEKDDQLEQLKTYLEFKIPAEVPEKVESVEVITVGSTSVSLSWAKAEGAELYYIYRMELMEGQNPDSVDFASAVKYSMSSAEKFTDKGCKSGKTYVYAVRAFNEKGLGELSLKSVVTTKSAMYKYDFDDASSNPVMDGWIQVTKNQMYDVSKGYGWLKAPGNGRYRGNNGNADSSAMADDFCMGEGEFALDLPNGDYEVVIYAGDLLSGTSTTKSSYTAEGIAIGTISVKTAIGTVAAIVRVVDGQLNIGVGGTNAYINGMEVTPLLLAPKGLIYQELQFNETNANFLINFEGIEGAVSYKVYQKSSTDEAFRFVKEINAADIGDLNALAMAASIGETMKYYVTAILADGTETAPSNTISIEMIDPSALPPGRPVNLKNVSTNREEIAISWDAVEGAITYNIYRSERLEGTKGYTGYKKVGVSKEPFYTDMEEGLTVNIPYYYKVQATGRGGVGELSAVLTTPVTETLVRKAAEKLTDRALAAVDLSGNKGGEINVTTKDMNGNELTSGVYLSWRLFEADPADVTFDIYRNNTKIASNLTVTNCVDPDGTANDLYKVIGSSDSSLGVVLKQVETRTWKNYYIEMQLDKPADQVMPDEKIATYTANDMSVGDLNGDGDYELIIKWAPSNGQDNSKDGYTGTTILDAYDIDTATGEAVLLWRIDLGVNIRSGAHYTQFQVWDFDGDGSAEVMCKTADGSTSYQNINGVLEETGYVGACSASELPTNLRNGANDYRNASGYVLSGPEYLTIFDGETGRILDTTDYIPARGSVDAWGDAYGNRVDRFLSATAYLDGENPTAIFARGYYTRTCVTAYDFVDINGDGTGDKLKVRWAFDTKNEPNGKDLEAQGNHGLSVNDVDGDGRDEIIYGAIVLDHDGSLKFSTGLGHGDAMHVSDFIPSRPGLEIFSVHEHTNAKYQVEMHDAETGEILWGYFTGKDTGRGVAADVDPNYPGAEMWANAAWNGIDGGLYSSLSTLEKFIKIADKTPSVNFSLFWDGDLLSELQDHKFIDDGTRYEPVNVNLTKWNYTVKSSEKLLESSEILTSNGTKGNLGLVADILGDWREEIIARSSADNSKIRIYTSTIQTDYMLPCLMENDAYRIGIAWQNVGYNQPANLSYLLSEGLMTSRLMAGKVTSTSATIIFTEASDGVYGHEITGYEVYRAKENGTYEKIDMLELDELIEVTEGGQMIEEPVEYKFDFGSKALQEGWIPINANSPAYEEHGTYGFTQASKALGYSDKAYSSNTSELAAMYNDCVLGWNDIEAYEFKVKVPNGTYEVIYYTYNGSGSQYNQVAVEGKNLPDIRRGSSSITEIVHSVAVEVEDGTIDVINKSSKSGNPAIYFNGLTIKRIVEETQPSEGTFYGFADETVEADTTYYYKIAAVVNGKTSFLSEAVTLRTSVDIGEVPEFTLEDIVEDAFIPEGSTAASLLPAEIKVIDKGGNETMAKAVWDISSLNIAVPGDYVVKAMLDGLTQPIEKSVKVIPNRIVSYEFAGYTKTGNEEPYYTAEAVRNSGDLKLPITVTFQYLNGRSEDAEVTWDTQTVDLSTEGTYVVLGTANPAAHSGRFGTQEVKMKVVVKEDIIIALETLPNIEVATGSTAEELRSLLPVTAEAVYQSGKKAPVTVSWNTDAAEELLAAGQDFVLIGTVEQYSQAITIQIVIGYKAVWKFDFGINKNDVASGWNGVTVNAKGGTKTAKDLNIEYTKEKGFGFENPSTIVEGRNENYTQEGTLSPAVYRDFVLPAGQTFLVDVPNGTYQLEFSAGSAYSCSVVLTVDGGEFPVTASVSNAANTYNIGKVSSVAVKNGQMKMSFSGNTPRMNMIIIKEISLEETPEITITPTPGEPTPTPEVTVTPTPEGPTPTSEPVSGPTEESKDKFEVEGLNNAISWSDVIDYLENTTDNGQSSNNLVITLGQNSVVPKEVFHALRGQETELKIQFEGYSWSIKGKNITGNKLNDINLSIERNVTGIPNTAINGIADEKSTLPIGLSHNGDFGLTATLSIDLSKYNTDKIANLFYYNPITGRLQLQSVSRVDGKGIADLNFTHASKYIIVLDEKVLFTEAMKDISVEAAARTLYFGGNQDNKTKLELKLPKAVEEAVHQELIEVKVSYKTENNAVAAVTADGEITARGKGRTVITATVTIEDVTVTLSNTITVKAAQLKILDMTGTMQVGDQFTFKVRSYGYKQSEIKYMTAKKSVVVIAKTTGKSKAVSAGTDYVVVTCGTLTKKIKITVKK